MNMVPTDPAQRIKIHLVSVTPMESKQSHQTAGQKKIPTPFPAKTVREISGQLADIELKLDHIIETIKDSLHRMNMESSRRDEP